MTEKTVMAKKNSPHVPVDNLATWNALRTPPSEALSKISGGRLKGMTDIKPQWRYQVMTERFGMCGIGWKYEIVETRSEQGLENQVFAFANVNLYVKVGGEWSAPIPASGGAMLIKKEINSLYHNDEAYKMAVTDALGTAMKMLGVAADIYMGQASGSKYAMPFRQQTGEVSAVPGGSGESARAIPPEAAPPKIVEPWKQQPKGKIAQLRNIIAIYAALGKGDVESIKKDMGELFDGIDDSAKLTDNQVRLWLENARAEAITKFERGQ